MGKFLTLDHNYFFRPTFAILYIFFILLYFLARNLLHRRALTQRESLINAIECLKEGVLNEWDEVDKQTALNFLQHADPHFSSFPYLHSLIQSLPAHPKRPLFYWQRLSQSLRKKYRTWASTNIFANIIAVIFFALVLFLLFDLGYLIRAVFVSHQLRFTGWAALIAGGITAIFVGIGDVLLLKRRRLAAYQWFERALLVALLVGQVFVFVRIQLKGFINLILLLFLWFSVRYMIFLENSKKIKNSDDKNRGVSC